MPPCSSLGEVAHAFDFAVAESVFPALPFNGVARCIASVVRKLQPSGRFYATWFENPDPANFDPIVQPNGVTTYPDHEPYHYPFALVANVCGAVGATVDRVADAMHPGGESVLVISPGCEASLRSATRSSCAREPRPTGIGYSLGTLLTSEPSSQRPPSQSVRPFLRADRRGVAGGADSKRGRAGR